MSILSRQALTILAIVVFSSAAWAQSTILQSGSVAPGQIAVWKNKGVQAAAGPAGGGVAGQGIGEMLQINPVAPTGTGPDGTHNCFYSGPLTGNSTFMCWDANALGGPLIEVGHLGSGAPANFQYKIEGVVYPFPAGGGNALAPGTPGSTVANNLTCWNNTGGTLIKNCTGPSVMGVLTDPLVAQFGTPALSVGSNTGATNTSLFGAVQDGVVNGSFPGGVNAFCHITAAGHGNSCVGVYGSAYLDPTTGGLAEAAELDSFSAATPQATVPITRGPAGGVTQNLPIGITISAATSGAYTQNSSVGIDMESNGGKFAAAGIYINPSSLTSGAFAINAGGTVQFGSSLTSVAQMRIVGGTGANDPNGALIEFSNTSTGVTSPNKFLRVNGTAAGGSGNLEFLSSSASTLLMSLTDLGFLALTAAWQSPPIVSASLTTCNGTAEGTFRPVSDSSSAVFNATFTGSGSNHIVAYCNGTAWVVH